MSPEQTSPSSDSRLSVLEVSVLLVMLVCGVIFAAVSVQDRLVQSRTDRLLSRAQAVSDWVSAAHEARVRAASLEPDRCSATHHQPLSFCFTDMVSSGQPFAGLADRQESGPDAPAFVFIAAAQTVADGQPCSHLSGPVYLSAPQGAGRRRPDDWTGLIIVQNTSPMNDLSETVNRLDIGYCDWNQQLVWVSRSAAF